jgi:alpha-glucosidase (family GH31 glycosyl hydrolase)
MFRALISATLPLLFVLCAGTLYAICPDPEPTTNIKFAESDSAFIGMVVSKRNYQNKKDAKDDFVTGRYFRFKVQEMLRGTGGKFIEVYENNDSARMGLKVGHTYLVFAQKRRGDKLQGWCADAVDSKNGDYQKKISEVKEAMAEISALGLPPIFDPPSVGWNPAGESSENELEQWDYLKDQGDVKKGTKIHWHLRVSGVGSFNDQPCAFAYLYVQGVKNNGCCKKVIVYHPRPKKEIHLYINDIIGAEGKFMGVNKNGDVLFEGYSWKVTGVWGEKVEK